jgi:hypothetical protein
MRLKQRLPRARGASWGLRAVGAVALLVMAGVHLQRLLGAGYDQIPTIDTLFWINVASGTLLAVAILISGQWLVALCGAAVSAGAIVALLISHTSGLFGFTEPSYGGAVLVALVSEGIAVAALLGVVALRLADDRRGAREARHRMLGESTT